MFCDTTNGMIYLKRGQPGMAAASFVAIIPIAGTIISKGGKVILKNGGEETLQNFVKQSSKEIEEKFAKGAAQTIAARLVKDQSPQELVKVATELASNPAISKASSAIVKVLEGDNVLAKKIFDALDKGYGPMRPQLAKDGSTIFTKDTLDGNLRVQYRTFSTSPALSPFSKIEATIDVMDLTLGKKILGVNFEIKFGSLLN